MENERVIIIPPEISEKLEKKRFIFPEDPEIRDRLKIIQDIFWAIQKKFPEVVSFQAFGSAVKGYANKESDIDLWAVVDREKTLEIVRQKMSDKELMECMIDDAKELALEDERLGTMMITIKVVLVRALSVSEESLRDVKYFAVSENIIREYLSDHLVPIEKFSYLFLLTIGNIKKIREWRKLIFDELEKQGDAGEKKWKKIAEYMWHFERLGHGEKEINQNLYPLTIAEARKRFA